MKKRKHIYLVQIEFHIWQKTSLFQFVHITSVSQRPNRGDRSSPANIPLLSESCWGSYVQHTNTQAPMFRHLRSIIESKPLYHWLLITRVWARMLDKLTLSKLKTFNPARLKVDSDEVLQMWLALGRRFLLIGPRGDGQHLSLIKLQISELFVPSQYS